MKTKQLNVGIALLKNIFAFLVITLFYWEVNRTTAGVKGWLAYFAEFSVYAFTFLSFFLNEPGISGSKRGFLGDRLMRLLIPYVGWAIIYWIVAWIVGRFAEERYDITFRILLNQLLTGNSSALNPVLWFSLDMVLITLLFVGISALFKRNATIVYWVLTIVFVIFQFISPESFLRGLHTEIFATANWLIKMLPFASLGMALSLNNADKGVREHRIISFVLATLIIWGVRLGGRYIAMPTFVWAIFAVPAVSVLFYVLPFDLLPGKVNRFLSGLLDRTAGIYEMQVLVGMIIHYFASHRAFFVETYTFRDCILIYAVCWVLALVISLIPSKWCKMMVE